MKKIKRFKYDFMVGTGEDEGLKYLGFTIEKKLFSPYTCIVELIVGTEHFQVFRKGEVVDRFINKLHHSDFELKPNKNRNSLVELGRTTIIIDEISVENPSNDNLLTLCLEFCCYMIGKEDMISKLKKFLESDTLYYKSLKEYIEKGKKFDINKDYYLDDMKKNNFPKREFFS